MERWCFGLGRWGQYISITSHHQNHQYSISNKDVSPQPTTKDIIYLSSLFFSGVLASWTFSLGDKIFIIGTEDCRNEISITFTPLLWRWPTYNHEMDTFYQIYCLGVSPNKNTNWLWSRILHAVLFLQDKKNYVTVWTTHCVASPPPPLIYGCVQRPSFLKTT